MGLAPITTSGPTITVSSLTELMNAYADLSSTSGGGKILLQSGDYSNLSLLASSGGDGPVIIASAEPSDPATFDRLSFDNVSNVRIEDVHVDNPTNGSAASSVVKIQNGSDNIQLTGLEINGLVDSVYDGHYGVHIENSSNVGVYESFIHDVKNGIFTSNSEGIEISGNSVDWLGNDGMKFSSVTDVLIEDNFGPRMFFPADGAHLDFIQFQGGDSSDIVIRGNVLLLDNVANVQGIFMDDAHFTNVLIEQNIILTGQIRGISVSSGTNVVARDNTVLDIDGAGSKATLVMVDGESYGNIMGTYPSDAEQGTNLKLQQTDPDGPLHYDDVFVNADVGRGMTIADLTPTDSSLALEYGATERLLELIGAPPPASDQAETVSPPSDTTVGEEEAVSPPSDTTVGEEEAVSPPSGPTVVEEISYELTVPDRFENDQAGASHSVNDPVAEEAGSDGGSKFFLMEILEKILAIFGLGSSDDEYQSAVKHSKTADDGTTLGEVIPITRVLDDDMPDRSIEDDLLETDFVD